MDPVILEELPVGFVHIDLVCKDSGRKETETLFEKFDLKLCIGFLVVGIPVQMVNEGVPFIDAGSRLGTELGPGFGLPPDYWSKMWLEDADDAVGALMHIVGQHLQLLMIHLDNGCHGPFLV